MRFHIPKFQTGNFSNFFMLGFRRTTAATTASLSEDSIIRFFHKYRATFTLFILKKKRYHKKSRQETFFNSLRACLSFNMTSNASVYASLGYSGGYLSYLSSCCVTLCSPLWNYWKKICTFSNIIDLL